MTSEHIIHSWRVFSYNIICELKKDHLNLPIRIYTYQTMMKVGTSKIAKYLNLSKSLED